jgi:2-keto-4-pentenoate hydratase
MGDAQRGAGRVEVVEAARRLELAEQDRRPCAPVRDLVADVATAYEVQTLNNEARLARGWRPVGWKVGLTNPVVQKQLGVDQPDFGRLFAPMAVLDDLPADVTLLQPRVEAEVAFVLERDLTGPSVTAIDVVRATAFVLPAIEIVDSRIDRWDISIVDTIADNASSAAFVVGAHPVSLSSVDLREVRMELRGTDGTVLSSGGGAACLGHPVNAVVWLANTLTALGSPLRAGDLVLSGALGRMVDVAAGAVYEAAIEGLGTVRARFG